MEDEDMLPVSVETARMWTISEDRLTVRLNLPPIMLEDLERPLGLVLDFEAGAVDEIIERLSVLRAGMLPPPARQS